MNTTDTTTAKAFNLMARELHRRAEWFSRQYDELTPRTYDRGDALVEVIDALRGAAYGLTSQAATINTPKES